MGVETTMRIGLLVNPAHYNSGWHATATLGVYGATTAAGLLMGLDEEQLTHALGIAASLGSGVKANFGSDIKALQVGHAAGNGLWAAELAQRGIKAAPGSLFGERGLLRMTGAPAGPHDVMAQFGAPYGLVRPGVNIKLYPCCSSCHTAVDAILDLRTEHAIGPADLARIDVWVGKDVPQIMIYDVPSTGLEGKFSLRYCVAAAAQTGALTLADFTDSALTRPGLMELIGRTHQHVDPSFAPGGGTGVTHQARVRIETRSGAVLERLVTDPLGSTTRPLPEGRLREKFMTCTRDGLGAERAEAAFRALMNAGTDGSARRLIDSLIRA
jgi:2-methylcitrate dehydratase PrpD